VDWKNIVNLTKLEFEPGPGQLNENYKYDWAPMVSQMGAKKLGFNVSILPPGQFSCPYHFHHSEEELFLILEGSAILRQAEHYREDAQSVPSANASPVPEFLMWLCAMFSCRARTRQLP
jgi:hypothetical protein